jgi:acyl-coenzyme A synthetase/AMP-(fatty) acid ligase
MGETGVETSRLGGCAFRTGDFFRSDADGFLYFVGRRDDVVKIDGENADPWEVEQVLLALPGVREAAVIGVPDPVLGHAFKAVVALEDGASLSEHQVVAHCAHHLEDLLVPRQVEFRPALPKTKAGAVNRQLIEEDAREAAE